MLSIVLVCAILTYGGVSLFVVVFAAYPFAAEMFRQSDIPKRLIPGTIALGAFTFTMDSLPGTPQIQNIIPTTFFKTDDLGRARSLGIIGAIFILIVGHRLSRMAAPPGRRRPAKATATGHINEPEPMVDEQARRARRSPSCRWSSSASSTSVFTVGDSRRSTAPTTKCSCAGMAARHHGRRGVGDRHLGGHGRAAVWHPRRCSSSPFARSARNSPRAAKRRSPARCSPR